MTFGEILVSVLIVAATVYLKRFVAQKAENLAQKQDLEALTTIVERVKSQFGRADLANKLQLEKEFSACTNTWSDACIVHKEFCRLYPIALTGSPPENQMEVFTAAQLKFTDTLNANEPFIREDVWKAFQDFEFEIVSWKD